MIADVVLTNENIEVLTDFALFRQDAVMKSGAHSPELFERLSNRFG